MPTTTVTETAPQTSTGADEPVSHITEYAHARFAICGADVRDSTATQLSPICKTCLSKAGVLGISPDQFFDEYMWV